MTDYIFVERNGSIVTLTLNSGRKLNALNMETWEQLGQAINKISSEDEVRCVILRGPDRSAFAAGADIAEFDTVRANSANAKAYGDLVSQTVLAIAACRHPTIALIHGICGFVASPAGLASRSIGLVWLSAILNSDC
jgi:enoyl-CoA hydratase